MKIACIGGIKHGLARDVLISFDKTQLEWEFKTEIPFKQPVYEGGALRINLTPEYQIYQLKILKINGELKYFYIAKDLPIDEIKSGLDECWELSDNLGYDLD